MDEPPDVPGHEEPVRGGHREGHPGVRSHVFEANAGDRLVCVDRLIDFQPAALDYCQSEPYRWEEVAFRPHEMASRVEEHRGELFNVDACARMAQSFFEDQLPDLVEEHRSHFFWHFRWGVRQEVEIVFNDERRAGCSIFGPTLREPGESPLAVAFTVMSAGLFVGLVGGSVSWDFAVMSGEYRYHHHTYRVDETGLEAPAPGRVPDVMRSFFGDAEAKERFLTSQVERLMSFAK